MISASLLLPLWRWFHRGSLCAGACPITCPGSAPRPRRDSPLTFSLAFPVPTCPRTTEATQGPREAGPNKPLAHAALPSLTSFAKRGSPYWPLSTLVRLSVASGHHRSIPVHLTCGNACLTHSHPTAISDDPCRLNPPLGPYLSTFPFTAVFHHGLKTSTSTSLLTSIFYLLYFLFAGHDLGPYASPFVCCLLQMLFAALICLLFITRKPAGAAKYLDPFLSSTLPKQRSSATTVVWSPFTDACILTTITFV